MLTRAPAPTKTVPLTIGRYSVIGRANVGVPNAYRARDPDGVLVAVYLFPADAVAKGRLIDRLAPAFETCHAIDHPNVLRVIDFGPEGSSGYLATEWTEGTTLSHLIRQHGRLPEANVVRLVAQIGQALDHTRSGDEALGRPTPAGVLVRQDGVAKVIPFGVETDRADPLGGASALLKPAFAAALAADYAGVKRVPFAEAVCSLGALVHEALTGAAWAPPEPPVGRRKRPAPRPAGLSDRAERAVRRATDPDPARRPATCAEFLKVLRGRSLTAGTPKPDARPPGGSDNRRGCVRYSVGVGSNCTINASVFDDGAFGPREVWPLVVQDVSATGVGILLARRCEPGTELSVEVATGPDRAPRSLPVRVVRVRKDSYGHWTHGCAFLAPLDEPTLAALLGHLGRADGV